MKKKVTVTVTALGRAETCGQNHPCNNAAIRLIHRGAQIMEALPAARRPPLRLVLERFDVLKVQGIDSVTQSFTAVVFGSVTLTGADSTRDQTGKRLGEREALRAGWAD